jgi:KaiC/GvpD/RAD55 family RecA-like ATPase
MTPAVRDIENLTDQITNVYDKYIAPHHKVEAAPPVIVSDVRIDVDERLKLAYKSKSGPKIRSLMAGDLSAHANNHSDADMALMMHLAYWFGNDAVLMREVFERSVLSNRDKWRKRTDYRERTIREAQQRTSKVYIPPAPVISQEDQLRERLSQIKAECPTVAKTEADDVVDNYVDETPSSHKSDDAMNAIAVLGASIERLAESLVSKNQPRLKPVVGPNVADAMEMLETSFLSTMNVPPIGFYEEPYIMQRGIHGLTGEPGSGKTTLLFHWLFDITKKNPMVFAIYNDADNPVSSTKQRAETIRGERADFIHYWGGSNIDKEGNNIQPWEIEDIRWLEVIKALVEAGKEPLLIFDTMNSFMMGGNENDNAVVGKMMAHLRKMTNAGATVVLIHHTGKSATSKESRGASAFKGAIDIGILVESDIVDCMITTMRVKAFKSRLGNVKPRTYKMIDGKLFEATQEQTEDIVLQFVIEHEGLSRDGLEKAVKAGPKFSRKLLRETVVNGLLKKQLVDIDGKIYSKSTAEIIRKEKEKEKENETM